MLGGFLHICTCTCTIYCGLWPPGNTSCTFITWYQSPGLGLIFSDAQLVRDFSTFLDPDLGFWPSPAARLLSPPSRARLPAVVLSVLLPTRRRRSLLPWEDLSEPPRSQQEAAPTLLPGAHAAAPALEISSVRPRESAPWPSASSAVQSAPGQISAPRLDLSRSPWESARHCHRWLVCSIWIGRELT
jgi:hypothetical protein